MVKMYGFKGGLISMGSPKVSIRRFGNSFSNSPRKRMLNFSRPAVSRVPPMVQIHAKKNTP
ncbi:hypothetical protein C0J52_00076 [Blattella germanica]|nr:hypothetical protein C0J52_00076 [Blattella germanica]